MTTRTFRVTYQPDPEVDELLNEILAEMPEVVEVGTCKWESRTIKTIQPTCKGATRIFYKGIDYIYCPFCGAKIERI